MTGRHCSAVPPAAPCPPRGVVFRGGECFTGTLVGRTFGREGDRLVFLDGARNGFRLVSPGDSVGF